MAAMSRVRFTASGRLGIWDSIDKPGMEEWQVKLEELLQANAHGVIESHVNELAETIDPALATITAVCDKIIARGNPTLVDPNWERVLLSGLGSEFLRWEETNDPEVRFRMKDSLWSEGRIESLVDAAMDLLDLPWTDERPASRQRLSAKLQVQSSSEEQALYADLMAALGPGASGAVQRQALISDLVDGFATTGLAESRVDFALQLSRAHWVIEVDGVQHLERAQRGKDAFRDKVLQAAGWKVLRVEASRVRSCRSDWLAQTWADAEHEEKRSLTVGTTLRSVEAALRESMLHRAAWHLLLRPLAVHRCLRGLLMLYRYGALDATQPQRILALEEDMPAVADAFQMLQELWELTASLHPGLSVRPLTFSLDVIGTQYVQGTNVSGRYVDQPEGDYDAVISHSLLLGEGYSGSAQARTKPASAEGTLSIRRAIGCRADRRLLWAPASNNWVASCHHVQEGSLTRLLQIVFRKRKFRDGQFLSILRLIQGESTIVLLPTGGGKSLIYQFAGMLLPGMTVIVDPITSLMDDQVRSLKELGIDKAEGVSSQIEDIDEILQCMSRGEFFFVFVSPERLQSEKFRNEIQKVTGRVPISLVALDEAHCLSEWGHDFRPAYLNLPVNLQRYCMDRETEALPTLVALTGTASYAVLQDMRAELGIDSEEAIIRPESFDRPELNFEVRKITGRSRSQELSLIRKELPQYWNLASEEFDSLNSEETYGGLVFCPHVGGRKGIVAVAAGLGHKNYFGGKVPGKFAADWNPRMQDGRSPVSDSELQDLWNRHKRELQRRFSDNEVQEIVATKSFGMGIDKRNIRYTVHYVMPGSVEQFYQEAGRAGRDGHMAHCTVIYIDAGSEKAIKDILDEPDHSNAKRNLESMKQLGSQTDVLVPLDFLLNSFKSREEEKENVTELWREFLEGDSVRDSRTVQIPFRSADERGKRERCIYRLRIMGIVEDYTVNYMELVPKQQGWFSVETGDGNVNRIRQCLSAYLGKYKFQDYVEHQLGRVCARDSLQAVGQAIDVLVDFIYDAVVAKRKEAIRNMVQLCKDYEDSDSFRESILAYLEESPYTKTLNAWRGKSLREIGLAAVRKVLKDLEELKEGDEMGRLRGLVGTTRRVLEADPENVALRYLSVCARAVSPWESDRSVVGEVATLLVWARNEGFDMDWMQFELLNDVVLWRPTVAGRVAHTIVSGEVGLPFARKLLSVGRKYGDGVRVAALGAVSSNVVNAVTEISNFYEVDLPGGQDDARGE